MYRIDRGHVARAHHVLSYAHEKLLRCERDRLDQKSDISSFFHPLREIGILDFK